MAHMSLETREIIEESLKKQKSFTEIAKLTGFHRTSISDEIIKHRVLGKPRTYGIHDVYCKYEKDCSLYEGYVCTKKCEHFEHLQCLTTISAPYVCNGCNKRQNCKLQKFFYRAKNAEEMYRHDLKEARSGINIPKEIIIQINEVIAPLIKEKHQTVNQVYINHPDILCFSKSEFYRLVNDGIVDISNIDLPRQVKYRKRKKDTKKMKRTREESIIRVNRKYEDFQRFLIKHPNVIVVQLDTVEGKKGGKVFLTINITQYELMLIYLLDSQTAELVSKKIRWIQQIMGHDLYIAIFRCGLTDNGKEFYEPDVYETINDEKVCNLFYCDPSSPYQKACCEVNHHYIRYYLPKGNCTFDDLTQEDCNLIMSNIASIPRDKLDGKTPYEAIQEIIPVEILNKLGLTKIDKDDVSLSPDILKEKGKKHDSK